MKDKKYQIKLAPGALDDVPEEDQEELFNSLQEMLDNGTLFENSEPVDMQELKESDPDMYEKLSKPMGSIQ